MNCVYDADEGGVVGDWTAVAGADAYRVLRGDETIQDLPGTARSFVDSDANAGGEYTVQALDGAAVLAECRCTSEAFTCTSGLVCVDAGDEVDLSWDRAGGSLDVTGYEIRRNGELIDTLPPTASSYIDQPGTRTASYVVTTVTNPPGACADLVVLRAPARTWRSVRRCGSTWAETRRSTLRGENGWVSVPAASLPRRTRSGCVATRSVVRTRFATGACRSRPRSKSSDSTRPTRETPTSFSTIRWDLGADGLEDFTLDIPMEDGTYLVNLYFLECCCPQRHFKLALQGEIVDAGCQLRRLRRRSGDG